MSSSSDIPRYNATFDRFVVGENGALEYSFSAVGDVVVALFFRLVRDLPDTQLCADFDQCLRASLMPLASATYASQARALRDVFDPRRVAEDLFLLAFQTRDCRGGKGERVLFHKMFLLLAVHYPQTCAALVPLIAEYGYWKDVFLLLAIVDALSTEAQQRLHALTQRLIAFVAKQLRTDFAKVDEMQRRESERECVREEKGESVGEIEGEIAEEREENQKQANGLLDKKSDKSNANNSNKKLPLSLASKYAPREKHAFYRDHKRVFYRLLDAIFPQLAGDHVQQKQLYRRSLSRCSAHLEIAESKMCAQRFSEISFASLPALCLRKSSKAMLNELPHRAPLTAEERERGNRYPDNEDRVRARKNLLEALSRPESVKGAMLFPHELARRFLPGNRNRDGRQPSSAEKLVIEAQWRHLRESVRLRVASVSEKDSVSLSRLIPLVDVSGSMSGTPMEVAIALGILISEISSEAFRDRLLTFSSVPTWVDLSQAYSLKEKVRLVSRAPWGMSTDIEKAMDLISQVVLSHRLSEEEIPDLIIFSDMQFDAATRFDTTQEQKIRERFHNLGLEIAGKPFEAPRIVFWNLRGNTSGFPATASSENVQLLSGYSPSLFNALVDGGLDESLEDVQEKGEKKKKKVTPYDTVRRILDHERYDAVRDVLRKSSEGALGLVYTHGVPSCGKVSVVSEEKTTRVRRVGGGGRQASSLYDFIDLDDDSQFFSKTKPKRKPCDKKLRRAMRNIGRSGNVAKKDVVKFL